MYDQKQVRLPLHELFSELRDIYKKQGEDDGEKRTNATMAELLGVYQQRITNWSQGSDPSRGLPPWWAILKLCGEVGYEVRLQTDRVYLYSLNGEPDVRIIKPEPAK